MSENVTEYTDTEGVQYVAKPTEHGIVCVGCAHENNTFACEQSAPCYEGMSGRSDTIIWVVKK